MMSRIAKTYADGQIHLQYRGNPYLLSPKGLLSYNTGEPKNEEGVILFNNATQEVIRKYVEGK